MGRKPRSKHRQPSTAKPTAAPEDAANAVVPATEPPLAAPTPPPEPPPVDDRIRRVRRLTAGDLFAERFQLESVLGKGTFSIVWKAHDSANGRACALKIFGNAFQDAAALREGIESARTLEHPHIVRVFELVEDHERGLLAVAMELASGGSIEAKRAANPNGQMDPAEIAAWLGPVCAALALAHERGVVHRDIKPANLLLDEHGAVKIADFGLPAPLGAEPLHFIGRTTSDTPAYRSPEHLRGEPPQPADDLYALGVTLHELLTGAPPFLAATESYQLHKITTEPPPSVSVRRGEAIPPAWEETVAALLSRDATQRPATNEVAALLRAPAQEAPLPPPKQTSAPETPAPREETAPAKPTPPKRAAHTAPKLFQVASESASESAMPRSWIVVIVIGVIAVVALGAWLGRDTSRSRPATTPAPAETIAPPIPHAISKPAPRHDAI